MIQRKQNTWFRLTGPKKGFICLKQICWKKDPLILLLMNVKVFFTRLVLYFLRSPIHRLVIFSPYYVTLNLYKYKYMYICILNNTRCLGVKVFRGKVKEQNHVGLEQNRTISYQVHEWIVRNVEECLLTRRA